MEEIVNFFKVTLTEFGMKVAGALLVLIVGRAVIKKLCSLLDKGVLKKQPDPMIRSFAGSCVKITCYVILVIISASIVGIQMTSLIAVLSAATLAVGMALQGSLSNFAGGFLILLLRPFDIGDYIKVGSHEGSVDSIHIFYTMINTIDNKQIILPNGTLSNNTIINYTKNGKRRVDLDIGISYNEDFKRVINILWEVVGEEERVLKDEDNAIRVKDFGASSVNLTYRVWCNTADYWDVYFNSFESIKKKFDAEGIEIPFNQMDLHIKGLSDQMVKEKQKLMPEGLKKDYA